MRAPSVLDVGPGWRPIVQPLMNYCNKHGIEPLQIKEKFGSLRFYYRRATAEIGLGERDTELEIMIQNAELAAERTCEWCGAPGKRTQGGWIKTLCPEHTKRWYEGERWWIDKDDKHV